MHQAYMRSWYPWLREAGVETREHQGHFSHSKVLTVDGSRSLIGSFNYNNRSSVMDFECGLVIEDASFARDIESRLYERDVEEGVALAAPTRWDPGQQGRMLVSLSVFEVSSTFL